jgi:hypothetical protein
MLKLLIELTTINCKSSKTKQPKPKSYHLCKPLCNSTIPLPSSKKLHSNKVLSSKLALAKNSSSFSSSSSSSSSKLTATHHSCTFHREIQSFYANREKTIEIGESGWWVICGGLISDSSDLANTVLFSFLLLLAM